jgi:hypothetical protein
LISNFKKNMKTIKVQETVEYELVVPDDWDGKTFYCISALLIQKIKNFVIDTILAISIL